MTNMGRIRGQRKFAVDKLPARNTPNCHGPYV